MVKLIRLTTENDGNFNADLDAGIQVSPNASIAVQNLTFETEFPVITTGTGSKQKVIVRWDGNVPTLPVDGILETETYTSVNYLDLWTNIQNALNQTQELDTKDILDLNVNYGEYRVSIDKETNKTNIDYKLSPLSLPMISNDTAGIRTTPLFAISRSDLTETGVPVTSLNVNTINEDGGEYLGGLNQPLAATSNPTDKLENFMYPIDPCGVLSQGAGIFYCNISQLADNTLTSDFNGFGIGLSYDNLRNVATGTGGNGGDEIANSSRSFEIRCKRPQDDFTFHNQDQPGVEQTKTGLKPFRYSLVTHPTAGTHDILMIERLGGTIRGSVCNIDEATASEGQKLTIFEYTLPFADLAKPLYPYIYVCGNTLDAVAGKPTFTPHVLDDRNMNYEITERGQVLRADQYEDLPSGNPWTQSPGPVYTQNFDTVDVGNIATYRRVLTGSTVVTWWQPTDAVTWNVYTGVTAPIVGSVPALQATISRDTGIISFPGTTIFTPQQAPNTKPGSNDNAFTFYTETLGYYGAVLANSLNNTQFENDLYSNSQNMQIAISNLLLNVLGFDYASDVRTTGNTVILDGNLTKISVNNDNQCGYTLTADNTVGISNSDNYILLIDSNPVQSYDASKFNYNSSVSAVRTQNHRGRRKNILATIPVNDNTSGIVEFQANELVYIDLDNAQPQAIKNLRLRILNKDFEAIKTVGSSVLTLLIKDI